METVSYWYFLIYTDYSYNVNGTAIDVSCYRVTVRRCWQRYI